MRAVVQRCDGASVDVDGAVVGGFQGPGLTVLVGVARTDTEQEARRLAAKVWGLRLFEADRIASVPEPLHSSVPEPVKGPVAQPGAGSVPEPLHPSVPEPVEGPSPSAPTPRPADGPKELSASDLGLPVLVISQFTLYGRTAKGRRPTWEDAAPGPQAEPLVDAVVAELRRLGAAVSTGVFGAYMSVRLTNDGPFTVIVDV